MNGRTNSGTTVLNGSDIALEPITEFGLSGRDSSVLINWADPVDKYTNPGDELVIEWDHTVIIRKQGSAPTSIKDGTVVVESYTRNQYRYEAFTDTGLTNDVEYYYAAYSVTTVGAYSDIAIKSITPRMGFVFLTDSSAGTIGYLPNDLYNVICGSCEFNDILVIDAYGYSKYINSDLLISTFPMPTSDFSVNNYLAADEDHLIYMPDYAISYYDDQTTKCFDTDLVSQDLQYGGCETPVCGICGNYFICGGRNTTYAYPGWTYERDTLIASELNSSYFKTGYGNNAVYWQSGYSVAAGNYLLFISIDGNTDFYNFAVTEDLLTNQTTLNISSRYESRACSLSSYAVIGGGYNKSIDAIDENLVNHSSINNLPHALYGSDAVECNGLAIFCGGYDDNNKNAYYDFSALDEDFLILNRGIDKMKYRRISVKSGKVGKNMFIIASGMADQLPEDADWSEGQAAVEVYTF